MARNDRIEVTKGMSGYYAIHTAEYADSDIGWYRDIVNTGIGRYKTFDGAKKEAQDWSKSDEIPLVDNLIDSKEVTKIKGDTNTNECSI